MAIDLKAMDGPIPGENFTSDTKNYPWHRPPEYTDLDAAIEASFKKLTADEAAFGLLTVIEMGMTIAQVTETFLMSGIGSGKWTPDFAILMAGPVSHIIYLMAKGYGIDCDLGIDQKNKAPTTAFFKAAQIDKKKANVAGDDINLDQIKMNASGKGGFMGMNPEGESMKAEMSEDPMHDQEESY